MPWLQKARDQPEIRNPQKIRWPRYLVAPQSKAKRSHLRLISRQQQPGQIVAGWVRRWSKCQLPAPAQSRFPMRRPSTSSHVLEDVDSQQAEPQQCQELRGHREGMSQAHIESLKSRHWRMGPSRSGQKQAKQDKNNKAQWNAQATPVRKASPTKAIAAPPALTSA